MKTVYLRGENFLVHPVLDKGTSYDTFPPLQVPTSDYCAAHFRQYLKTAS